MDNIRNDAFNEYLQKYMPRPLINIRISDGCEVFSGQEKDDRATDFIRRYVDWNIKLSRPCSAESVDRVSDSFFDGIRSAFDADVYYMKENGAFMIPLLKSFDDGRMLYVISRDDGQSAMNEDIYLEDSSLIYDIGFLREFKRLDHELYDIMLESGLDMSIPYNEHQFSEFHESLAVLDQCGSIFHERLVSTDEGKWNVLNEGISDFRYLSDADDPIQVVHDYAVDAGEWFGKNFSRTFSSGRNARGDCDRAIYLLKRLAEIDEPFMSPEEREDMLGYIRIFQDIKKEYFPEEYRKAETKEASREPLSTLIRHADDRRDVGSHTDSSYKGRNRYKETGR